MARRAWQGLAGAMALALGGAGGSVAQGLDPRVAGPLMQLIQAAGLQCQAGNQQACAMVPQLQQMGNELTQAQFACQQGNPQACHVFQMGAQQVMGAWQQNFGGMQGGMPQAQAQSPQQQMWEHQQRMQQQRQMFDQHQERMRQQQQMFDEQNRRFREQLLR